MDRAPRRRTRALQLLLAGALVTLTVQLPPVGPAPAEAALRTAEPAARSKEGPPEPSSLPPQARPAADPDGDDVKDPHDNCRGTANTDQGDLDGDGTGDLCDPDWEGIGDATVLAVVDYQPFSPYVWDLDAAHMPQALDGEPDNDLPLDRNPAEWLPGYAHMPGTTVHPVDLTLSAEIEGEWPIDLATGKPDESLVTREMLTGKDRARIWDKPGFIKESGAEEVNLYWFKDTKVLGAAEFGDLAHDKGPYERSGLNRTSPAPAGSTFGDGHGVGTSSVSVGNLHGICPECLLVFLEVDVSGVDTGDDQPTDYAGIEEALEWAYAQPWIDAVVMQGAPSAQSGTRERAYSGSDLEKQRTAAEAGKTFFVSAGNGLDGVQGIAPSSTLLSSLQGPDWAVTVSGTDVTYSRDHTPTGFGKPADVSGTKSFYASAYGSSQVGGTGSGFVQTSNAVSVVSGTYVKALHEVRDATAGPSRRYGAGVVAEGAGGCGSIRPDCELADGRLTAAELRQRLLLGAVPTRPGAVQRAGIVTPGGRQEVMVPAHPEEDFASEGHGTYGGRCTVPVTPSEFVVRGTPVVLPVGNSLSSNPACRPMTLAEWEDRELTNVLGPLFGTKAQLDRRPGEAEWFRIDSYCRQQIWGGWRDGLFHTTDRPRPDADSEFPVRTAYEQVCPHFAAAYPDHVPAALKPYQPRGASPAPSPGR